MSMLPQIFCAGGLLIALGMVGCGGGGGASAPTVSGNSTATSFVLTASAGEGTTLSPTSVTVDAGKAAIFKAVLKPGYKDLQVTGAGGTLNGDTFTTAPVFSNATIVSSAQRSDPTKVLVKARIDLSGASVKPTEQLVTPGGFCRFEVTLPVGFQINRVSLEGLSGGTGKSGLTVTATNVQAPSGTGMVVVGTAAAVEPSQGYTPEDLKISPQAVFADEFRTTPIRMTLRSRFAALQKISITAEYRYWVGQGDVLVTIPFRDDGQGGDDSAGDGVFTAVFTPAYTPPLLQLNGKVGSLALLIKAADAQGATVITDRGYNYLDAYIGAIKREEVPVLTPLDSVASATSHILSLVRPHAFARDWWSRTEYACMVYDRFKDDFDFLVLRGVGMQPTEETWANSLHMSNATLGIGVRSMTQSLAYTGSDGRLKTILYSHGGNAFPAFLHELGHHACFFLDHQDLPLSDGRGHITRPKSHVGQDDFAQHLIENASGDFVLGLKGVGTYNNPYSMLELYLMGLVGPSDVPPEHFVFDPAYLNRPLGIVVPRDKTRRVTIDDIVRIYGPRVPDVTQSPKAFRLLHVVVSDRALKPAELLLEHTVAAFAESKPEGAAATMPPLTFWVATGGRGSVTTLLPPRK